VLSMLGKRVPARVNEGFCDCPGHRRRPNRRVCHRPLLHRSDSLHPSPPKCRWYCCSLCANVLGVRKPLLYAIVEVEGDQFARGPHAGLEHRSIRRLPISRVAINPNRRNACLRAIWRPFAGSYLKIRLSQKSCCARRRVNSWTSSIHFCHIVAEAPLRSTFKARPS
jgi:hypothetical protein